MAGDNITLHDLKNEIIGIKTELKNFIEASEVRISLKIEELKNRVKHLENENALLKDNVEKLERNQRKNNLVIFGLKPVANKTLQNFVIEELDKLLDVTLHTDNINNLFSLGSSEDSPIKLELCSYITKQNILSKVKKLKNTGVSISHDFTELQRAEYRALKPFLLQAKKQYDNCFIRNGKLFIDNTPYTLLELQENQILTGKQRADSAPPTPTQTNNQLKNEIQQDKNQEKDEPNSSNNIAAASTLSTPKTSLNGKSKPPTNNKLQRTTRTRSTNKQ